MAKAMARRWAEASADFASPALAEPILPGPGAPPAFRPVPGPGSVDLADVRGQHSARRALEIAAKEWGTSSEGREKLLKRLEAANTKPSFE